jgi:hypothetical protein
MSNKGRLPASGLGANKCTEVQKVQIVLTENKYTKVHKNAPKGIKKRKM